MVIAGDGGEGAGGHGARVPLAREGWLKIKAGMATTIPDLT